MNIYDDYINYLEESMEVLDVLRENNSPLLIVINDVIKVTDYIYQQYDKKKDINEDLEEIFSLGFGYLTNVLSDIKTYYEDCFDKNIEEMNKCASLLINLFILDDFKSFLDVSERLSDELKSKIESLIERLDLLIANKRSGKTEILDEIDILIDDYTPSDLSFRPVYTVFALIAEELSMTNDIEI